MPQDEGIGQPSLELIAEHYRKPRHFGAVPDADVVMPGGNPGCGDVVVIYLKADGDELRELRFEGQGCTVSQAGTSMLLEEVHRQGLSPQAILEMDYHHMEELLGSEVVKARPRCATLGLATLKGAIRAWQRKRAQQEGAAPPHPPDAHEAPGIVLGEAAQQAAGVGLPHDLPLPTPPATERAG